MKKIAILLIVLMVISVGFLSGCNEQMDTDNSTNENQSPTASCSANPTTGYKPLSVSFQGSGDDTDGTIVSYLWNFGDEEKSSLQNPNHVFQNSGTYTVILTVIDNNGATGIKTVIITVEELVVNMTREEIYGEFNNTFNKAHVPLYKILNELLSSQITYDLIMTWGNEIVNFCADYALQTLPNLSIPLEYEDAREEFNTTLQYFCWMGLDYLYYGKYEDADYGWDAVEHQNVAYEHWDNCKEMLGYE